MVMETSSHNLSQIRHTVLILSGKGGVGKSTVTTQLALTLADQGYKVGVLDVDLTGPSLPRMFGLVDAQVHQASSGWIPVYTDESRRLGLMSLGFLMPNKDDAVVWRGPKKTAMIRQFLEDVAWGELDYLLIDTPPGTSDEHISVVETLLKRPAPSTSSPDRPWKPITGAVVVTTPQAVSVADVRKELNFCKRTGVPVLGVVENMSGFICPHCADCTDIFSSGGGEKMAQDFGVGFLGRVPIDPTLTTLIEAPAVVPQEESTNPSDTPEMTDKPKESTTKGGYVHRFKESKLYPVFCDVTTKVISACEGSAPTTISE
ncbi:P-loop containing nucleoside triphosphate hydrolase protein [Phlyctochytrium arcticum]|nr:P-loop containing nucleoside triphosphate hydrolase protein [Phlyctochytrium arcticum]